MEAPIILAVRYAATLYRKIVEKCYVKLSKSDLKIKIGKESKFEVKSLQLMSCNIFIIKKYYLKEFF